MEKLTIAKYNLQTERNGAVMTDRKGRKYVRAGVQFEGKLDEQGNLRWWNAMSYNETDPIRKWRVGNVVDVELVIEDDKKDPNKKWYNIKMPRMQDALKARLDSAAVIIKEQGTKIESLEGRVQWCEDKLKNLVSEAPPATEVI